MKNFLTSLRIFSIGIFSLAFTMIYTGCKKDGCTDSTATNFDNEADKDDGTCAYNRDGLIGTYSVDGPVVCDLSGSFSYDNEIFTITKDPSATNKVKMDCAGGYIVTVVVTGSGTFTIEPFTHTLQSGPATVTGSGTFSSNAKTFNLNLNSDETNDNCQYTLQGSR